MQGEKHRQIASPEQEVRGSNPLGRSKISFLGHSRCAAFAAPTVGMSGSTTVVPLSLCCPFSVSFQHPFVAALSDAVRLINGPSMHVNLRPDPLRGSSIELQRARVRGWGEPSHDHTLAGKGGHLGVGAAGERGPETSRRPQSPQSGPNSGR